MDTTKIDEIVEQIDIIYDAAEPLGFTSSRAGWTYGKSEENALTQIGEALEKGTKLADSLPTSQSGKKEARAAFRAGTYKTGRSTSLLLIFGYPFDSEDCVRYRKLVETLDRDVLPGLLDIKALLVVEAAGDVPGPQVKTKTEIANDFILKAMKKDNTLLAWTLEQWQAEIKSKMGIDVGTSTIFETDAWKTIRLKRGLQEEEAKNREWQAGQNLDGDELEKHARQVKSNKSRAKKTLSPDNI